MFTGSDNIDRETAAGYAPPSGLLTDLAADPADLFDAAVALGVEFQSVVADLLARRAASSHDLSEVLAARAPGRRVAGPDAEPPPFVWVRVLPAEQSDATVRAGWLTPAALQLIVTDARAARAPARIEIFIPLDAGAGALARVRALCAALVDLDVVVRAQDETGEGWRTHPAFASGANARTEVRGGKRWGTGWWRRGGGAGRKQSDGRRQRTYRATWVAVGLTP